MRHPLFRLLCALPVVVSAASEPVKIWVDLKDKGAVSAGHASLGDRAWEDAPVSAPCLQSLRDAGLEISVVLKWQNRVSGWVEPSRLGSVSGLPCVRGVEEMPRKLPAAAPVPGESVLPRAAASSASMAQDFGAFQSVFAAVGADTLRDTVAARGLAPGAGVRIAVMDDGFRLGHKAFDSLFARGAIVDQWDFVAGASGAVNRTFGTSHGASTLSQIAGDLPGVLQGLAPRASFLLYRTEDEPTERYAEEDYLAAALERAVDSGAQVISISLGYRYDFDTEPEIPYAQMNGRSRPSSIAAVMAARRGAVVVVAVGNEGLRGSNPTLTAPSDADSILTVGATTPAGARCSYSGIGPSFDGRVKPEIASLGCTMPVANPATDALTYGQSGTSFAAPVVAGVAALLRQLHPASTGVTAQQIRLALMATGTRAATPDNQVGNGLARAAEAHRVLLWQIPASRLAAAPKPVQGTLSGRNGRAVSLPWSKGLDLSATRVWDLNGRAVRARGSRVERNGNTEIRPENNWASGVYVLKIPLESK